jgi:hypothetical protein
MYNCRDWIKGKLLADTQLMTLIGSSNNFVPHYPTNPAMWPWLTYRVIESTDHSTGFADDASFSDRFVIEFQGWHNQESDVQAIMLRLDFLMHTHLFARTYFEEFKLSDSNINRAIARYARSLTSADLI